MICLKHKNSDRLEYGADFPGVKATERVDYALFSKGSPVLFIEAKAYCENLVNHCPQLSRYYNATPEVAVAAITNGREWRFFTDLKNRNIMDQEPFLTINFESHADDVAESLERFHHDRLEPETLRALAEENVHLNLFKKTMTTVLRDCDLDFVRYVATRAGIQRTLTGRFLESVQPILKQAVAQAVSSMVATSLSQAETAAGAPVEIVPDEDAPIIDPNNEKIITTVEEQRLFKVCSDILAGEDLSPRDTESYFSVVHAGKSNRWIFRFWGDRKRPVLQFIVSLTAADKASITRAGLEIGSNDQIILDKAEDLYRVAGIVRDALAYCKNDENFRRGAKREVPVDEDAPPLLQAVR